jgi:ABC-2 type transport system ATP-binding protein
VDAGQLAELLGRLVAAGVLSLVSRPPTLEELFLRHYAAADGAGQPQVTA